MTPTETGKKEIKVRRREKKRRKKLRKKMNLRLCPQLLHEEGSTASVVVSSNGSKIVYQVSGKVSTDLKGSINK